MNVLTVVCQLCTNMHTHVHVCIYTLGIQRVNGTLLYNELLPVGGGTIFVSQLLYKILFTKTLSVFVANNT